MTGTDRDCIVSERDKIPWPVTFVIIVEMQVTGHVVFMFRDLFGRPQAALSVVVHTLLCCNPSQCWKTKTPEGGNLTQPDCVRVWVCLSVCFMGRLHMGTAHRWTVVLFPTRHPCALWSKRISLVILALWSQKRTQTPTHTLWKPLGSPVDVRS